MVLKLHREYKITSQRKTFSEKTWGSVCMTCTFWFISLPFWATKTSKMKRFKVRWRTGICDNDFRSFLFVLFFQSSKGVCLSLQGSWAKKIKGRALGLTVQKTEAYTPLLHSRAPFCQNQHFCSKWRKASGIRPHGKNLGAQGLQRSPHHPALSCFFAFWT